MKKVLMICYYYPPAQCAAIYRSCQFTKYLPKNGWQPIILTTNVYGNLFSDTNKKIYRTPDILSIRNKILFAITRKKRKISYIAEETKQHFWKKFLLDYFFIPDIQITWVLFSIYKAIKIIKKYKINLIYTTSPPESAHILGFIIKKLTHKRWVADFHDSWTFDPLKPILLKSKFRFNIENYLEKKVFSLADHLILNTECVENIYKNKFPQWRKKMSCIPYGYDHKEIEKVKKNLSIKKNTKFILIHTGCICARCVEPNLTPLWNVLKELKIEGKISANDFVIRFVGHIATKIKEEVKKFNIADIVEFIDYVPHEEAIRYMLLSDVLLVLDRISNNPGTYIHSKLYDYIGVGKPILAILSKGASEELIKKYKLGKVVLWREIASLKDILSQRKIERENIDCSEFRWDILTQKLAKLFYMVNDNEYC